LACSEPPPLDDGYRFPRLIKRGQIFEVVWILREA
jgi:hypothetical protein